MSLNTQEILLKYHSFADGLTSNEALVRQRKYGLNKIEQELWDNHTMACGGN